MPAIKVRGKEFVNSGLPTCVKLDSSATLVTNPMELSLNTQMLVLDSSSKQSSFGYFVYFSSACSYSWQRIATVYVVYIGLYGNMAAAMPRVTGCKHVYCVLITITQLVARLSICICVVNQTRENHMACSISNK
jgi:hypothetical protein